MVINVLVYIHVHVLCWESMAEMYNLHMYGTIHTVKIDIKIAYRHVQCRG